MKKNFLAKAATAALAVALTLSLAACGSINAAQSDTGSATNQAVPQEAGTTQENTDISSSESVQIPDPFEGFSKLEEAAAAAGFEMTVPDAPEGYQTVVYRVDADIQMVEVIYSDKDLEDDGTEGYRIRKAVGTDDISGDYNDYSETKTVSAGSNTITLKGNDGKVFVATWVLGDYTYAIDVDMGGQGLSADEVIAIAGATK